MAPRIRVAISGGGVAGATLIQALLQHPHLDVHIFESAAQFRETGVAFGIGRNATDALALVGPSTRACLDRAGGVQMREMYVGQGWMPHLDTAVRELICDQPSRQTISLWEHRNAHTYVSGPVCVIGDAAHATTPFMGSGGGMCVEDTLIMSSLLAQATSPAEAVVALRVHDRIRRPRTQDVVVASRQTGNLICGRDKDVGLDAAKLKNALARRWDFIFEFDNVQHRDEALMIFKKDLKSLAVASR